jgi:LysR family hydrogen peroxide-inducible transcriptional activator
MSTYLPTLKQLQYLVALRDHGHFGHAAESCFVTQSTLSAGIRELETLIGVTLVERTRRVVRFTPLGIRIAEKARKVLREAEELADMVRAAGKPLSGELRLAVIPTIAPFLLPGLLPRLRVRYPELRLFLREETSQLACDNLHRGQVDCVLLALPFACGDVECEPLFDDPLYVALPPGSEAAAPVLSTAAIEEEKLLLLEDGHCLKDHALAACERPELRNQTAMMGTSLHTLVQMVDGGLGMTIVPRMAVTGGIARGTGIVVRPLEAESPRGGGANPLGQRHPARRIALVWRRNSPREKEFRLLAEALREAGKEKEAASDADSLDAHGRTDPLAAA